jgi:phosphoglycolate phosphatase
MLHDVMDRTGVLPPRTLMIGDTTHDLQMAANAGVSGLGVSYGAHAREELLTAPARAIVDSGAELAEWLAALGQLGPDRQAAALAAHAG